MIGIPYFGEDTYNIINNIQKAQISADKVYPTVYEMIKQEAFKQTVVVIDNCWLTWLRDIRFNYRDREAKLPYYEFETYDIKVAKNYSNNKGHLLLNPETNIWYIRYNYMLKFLDFKSNTQLTVYDIEKQIKYTISAEDWFTDIFDLEELYAYYINSAYYEDDFLYNKHLGGYHYITRQFKGFINLEWKKCKELNLPNFAKEHYETVESDYRDVRQYKKEQLFGLKIIEHIIPYKLRRLLFDCLLYCIIQQGSLTADLVF